MRISKMITGLAVGTLLATLQAGCSPAGNGEGAAIAAKPLTANDIAAKLKATPLPISKITVLTAETDSNKLLGRPGQYISKADFVDDRYPDVDGLTVEVFETAEDAKRRHDYIEKVTKDMPFLLQYQYLEGKALVRLAKDISPDHAKAYGKALSGIMK